MEMQLLRFSSLFGIRKSRGTYWLVAFVACWICYAADLAPGQRPPEKWATIAPGMDLFSGSYRHRAPINSAKIWGIRIDPTRYQLRILDVSRLLRGQTQ